MARRKGHAHQVFNAQLEDSISRPSGLIELYIEANEALTRVMTRNGNSKLPNASKNSPDDFQDIGSQIIPSPGKKVGFATAYRSIDDRS